MSKLYWLFRTENCRVACARTEVRTTIMFLPGIPLASWLAELQSETCLSLMFLPPCRYLFRASGCDCAVTRVGDLRVGPTWVFLFSFCGWCWLLEWNTRVIQGCEKCVRISIQLITEKSRNDYDSSMWPFRISHFRKDLLGSLSNVWILMWLVVFYAVCNTYSESFFPLLVIQFDKVSATVFFIAFAYAWDTS